MSNLSATHPPISQTVTGWVVAPARPAKRIDPALLHSMFSGDILVKIENAPQVERLAGALLQRSVGDINWGSLIGAPDEAIVHVSAVQIPSPSGTHDAISIQCEHFYIDDFGVELQLYADPAGAQLVAELVNFYLTDFAPEGLGTLMFAKLVAALSATFPGVLCQLKTIAGRMLPADEQRHGRLLVGYYVWPALGFDRDLQQIYQPAAGNPWASLAEPPAALLQPRATTLQDLLECAGGKPWWLENGRPAELCFDLRPNSRSHQVLWASLCRKQLAAL